VSVSPTPDDDARTHNRWRRWGYRLLPGDLFSYVLHLRPAEWPIMAGHTALGYFLAVGWSGAGSGEQLLPALAALLIWVIMGNGGTLALNSVFDRDQGDIGYLTAPPPLPRHLLGFSVALLVGGQLLAFRLPTPFALAYGACVVLSVLYSVPPFRLKAVAGADGLINMLGFGTLTPYATWAATGRPLDGGHALVLLAFCPLFSGLYPLTQLYQLEEDRRRGDRTLALRLGTRRSLAVALAGTLVAFGAFGGAVAALRPGSRAALLGVAFAAWLVVLVPWYRGHASWSPAEHQRGMYRALAAWAVTDVIVLLVFAG
jgi:4-hydroxybenzoate polyprenyltransferase